MPTVKDLKKLAKERDLRGYSKLRKAELLSLLKKTIPAPRKKEKVFLKNQFQLREEIFLKNQFQLQEQKEKIFLKTQFQLREIS